MEDYLGNPLKEGDEVLYPTNVYGKGLILKRARIKKLTKVKIRLEGNHLKHPHQVIKLTGLDHEVPTSPREWDYFPILMITDADGKGPADISEASSLNFEVWRASDLQTVAVHNNVPDAIQDALERTIYERKQWDS